MRVSVEAEEAAAEREHIDIRLGLVRRILSQESSTLRTRPTSRSGSN
jgi:hypothetical protein